MEARADEAGQVMRGQGRAQMPSIADARMALAIHGEREGFRTVTIKFESPEDALEFDKRAARTDTMDAIDAWAIDAEVVTRP